MPKRMTGWLRAGPLVAAAFLAGGCAVESNPPVGAQYVDTGWMGPFFVSLLAFCILFNIFRAGRGRDLYIRRIAGLNALDEAVGRATEMGRPVLMVPGLSATVDAIAVQALNIFAYVTRLAAKFGNPILLCCYNAAVYTVAQEIIRDVYQSEGLPERYDQDSVRFISDRQFAFAAGVSGLIHREQTAATFFLGAFYAESLIFAETANSVGAIQVASSTEITQTPFFIAACDYVLIGDEFYAASAYLTRQPVLVGSLIGQDWSKILVIGTILVGVLMNTVQFRGGDVTREKVKGVWVDLPEGRRQQEKDLLMNQLFAAQKPDLTVDRPKEEPETPTEGAPE